MDEWYWIHANIDGKRRWHMVFDRRPGLFFVKSDFEEEEYDIDEYQQDFPDNEVIPVLSAYQTKHSRGICDDHTKTWNREDCPLCDASLLRDWLQLALAVMGNAVESLSLIPDTGNVDSDNAQDEVNRGQVCIMIEKFLAYARASIAGETCTCGDVGGDRCPRHGWENYMADLRRQRQKSLKRYGFKDGNGEG